MLKQLVNECVITLQIEPEGPILIKSGVTTVSGPDMAFVKVWRNGEEQVYLPGSSLKGVLRSHAERIARTLNPAAACNPFAKVEEEASSCGQIFDRLKRSGVLPDPQDNADKVNKLVYAYSCPMCKLFGSTWYAGRLATADAYAEGRVPQPQPRDGVGLDRFTGGASHAVKFDLEVITEGVFVTTLHLRNFELWQLGLVGFVLADLNEGLIRIGAAKSRGLGKVRGKTREVQLHFLGPRAPQPESDHLLLRGMGALTDVTAYGVKAGDEVQIPFAAGDGAWRSNGLRSTATWQGDTFPWDAVGPRWVSYAEAFQDAAEMQRWRGRQG